MPDYAAAKLAADEVLTVLGEERAAKDGFGYLVLRPGGLKDGKGEGKIMLGKIPVTNSVFRGDVADVGVRLLEMDGVKGWFDMTGGEEEIGKEVERVLADGVNSMEGESLEAMNANI